MALFQDMRGWPVTKTAVSYTITPQDVIIAVTNTGAARTISTTAADQIATRILVIKDQSGGAATNNITFDPAGAVTIDGASTKVINTNYGSVMMYCDGTNWFSF